MEFEFLIKIEGEQNFEHFRVIKINQLTVEMTFMDSRSFATIDLCLIEERISDMNS